MTSLASAYHDILSTLSSPIHFALVFQLAIARHNEMLIATFKR